MKKIAHVQVIPKLSGAQQISLDILASIKDDDVDKYIICGELDGALSKEFAQRFESAGVKIISLSSLKRNIGIHDLKCFIELYKVFKKEKFDIVHTNSTKPGIIARIAARIAGVKKIIHTVHGIAFHNNERMMKRVFYYLIENVATLFGDVNVTVNKIYTKYYPFAKNVVVYNGVDLNLFKVDKIKDDSLHFAFMARLDEQKNPLEFIRAVKLVTQHCSRENIKFTLAGDGELNSECKALIHELGLENVINMPGWILDKDKFYNSVDVICQPSRWEAFGLVFVEAACFNIPSISKPIEGIPEVVRHGETGILYTGGEKELSEAIISLVENKSMVRILGENARSFAYANFTKEKMVTEYCRIYQL